MCLACNAGVTAAKAAQERITAALAQGALPDPRDLQIVNNCRDPIAEQLQDELMESLMKDFKAPIQFRFLSKVFRATRGLR